MKRFSGSIIILGLLAISSCIYYSRPALDTDFIEVPADSTRANLDEEISQVKEQLIERYEEAGLHRRLAVLYRLAGTIESRNMSIREIDRAIELEPDNAVNYVEKALTLFNQQMVGEAEKNLREARKIDPGSFQAWYQQARIYKYKYLKNMCFVEHSERAIACYKKALNIDNTHKDTLFNLGLLHLKRRMIKTSTKYARRGLKLYPRCKRFHLLMAVIYMDSNEFEKASEEFSIALSMMDDREKVDYLDTSPLLSNDMRERYFSWTDDEKLEWNRVFWLRNDPTPATEINERLLEHYERVFLARELLTIDRLEMNGPETARGKALVCYGLPDRLLYIAGAETDGPMVAWVYDKYDRPFKLYFMDEFLNGNYQIPIDPKFGYYSSVTRNVTNNIRQAYRYPIPYGPLPVFVQDAQTKGPGEKTRIEFALAFPDSAIDDSNCKYRMAMTVFDSNWDRIFSENYNIAPGSLSSIRKPGGSYRTFHFNIDMIPRPLESSYAIEIVGGKPERRAVWKSSFTIDDLGGRLLKLSSVIFNQQEDDGLCMYGLDPLPAYPPGSHLCLSYYIYNLKPDSTNIARYRITYTIVDAVKFEDRPDSFRKTLSWISASVRGRKPGDSPYITSSLVQSTNSRSASDRLQIDLGSLQPKKYMLVLDVDDLLSGEKASSERIFEITN